MDPPHDERGAPPSPPLPPPSPFPGPSYHPAALLAAASPMPALLLGGGGGGFGLFPPTPTPGLGLLTPLAAQGIMQGIVLPSPSAAMAALAAEGGEEEGMELEDDGLGGGGEMPALHDPHASGTLDMTPAALLRMPLLQGPGTHADGNDDPLLHLLAAYMQYERALAAASVVVGAAPAATAAAADAALPAVDAVRAELAGLRAGAVAGKEEEGEDGGDKGLLARFFVSQARASLEHAVAEAHALAMEEENFWAHVDTDASAWQAAGKEGQRAAEAAAALLGAGVDLDGGKGKGKGKGTKPKKAKAKNCKPPRPATAASAASASATASAGITKLPAASIAPLVAWLLEQYPGKHAPTTAEEKALLGRKSALTDKQVASWFSNFK